MSVTPHIPIHIPPQTSQAVQLRHARSVILDRWFAPYYLRHVPLETEREEKAWIRVLDNVAPEVDRLADQGVSCTLMNWFVHDPRFVGDPMCPSALLDIGWGVVGIAALPIEDGWWVDFHNPPGEEIQVELWLGVTCMDAAVAVRTLLG